MFIWSKSQWHSPTAEFLKITLFIPPAPRKNNNARIRVNQKMIDRADVLFEMERKYRDMITERYIISNQPVIGWKYPTITLLETPN